MTASFDYFIKYYGVPAKKGCRIIYTGGEEPKNGVIIGVKGPYLKIKLDGETYAGVYHPTWELQYLDENGEVIFPVENAQ
jgi:hypothetical protein